MNKRYTVKTLAPGDELADAFLVRVAVFIDEQGFDPALDVDEIDPAAHHIVLYDNTAPVATGRVFADPATPGGCIIGRVAVLPQCRGGTGRQLMGELEALARQLGAREARLGAQCRAQGFYAKLGYEPYGDTYHDEHCLHIHMKKDL